MKRFLITALLIASTCGFANAQAKHKVIAHKADSTKHTSMHPVSHAATTASVSKSGKKSAVAASHLKTNGTADTHSKADKKK